MATIPEKPQTNLEQYLNRIATGDGEYPAKPRTNVEQYLNYIIENGIGGGGEAKVVDELPAEGETGYIYLVLKESTKEGDIYDEWIWALQQDGETYDWEHLGATNEVSIKLYDTEGDNTDGAMTQRAATAMKGMARVLTTDDYNINSRTWSTVDPSTFNTVALWLLPPGLYSCINNGASVHIDRNNSLLNIPSGGRTILVLNGQNNSKIILTSSGTARLYACYTDAYGWGNDVRGNLDSRTILTRYELENSLNSQDSDRALAAPQGRILKAQIGDLAALDTATQTDLVSAINEVAAQSGAASLTNAEFNEIFGTSLEEES